MKIKSLLEAYNIIQDGKFKFADVDVEGLCNSVVPKELHYISKNEIQQVRDFLKLDEVETEEELRAIRNSIVRYITDKALELRPEQEELSKKWHEENPDGDFSDFMKQNPYDILWDQMSAFTHVIDMELHKRYGHV